MKTHIRTKAETAKALKISRPTLDKYLDLPGAPTRVKEGWNMEEIINFIASHTPSEVTGAKVDIGIRKLKERELGLRCERMRFNLDREKGKYILVATVAAKLFELSVGQKNLLRQRLENECPSQICDLRDPAAVRIILKRVVDEICEKMRGLVADWDC